jgi:hypothetical protein
MIKVCTSTGQHNTEGIYIHTFVYVWNVVSDIKGGILIQRVWEEDAENICSQEGWDNRRLEKTAHWAAS